MVSIAFTAVIVVVIGRLLLTFAGHTSSGRESVVAIGVLLLLLLLKPAAHAQVGKTKLFVNCFRNPTSTCATKN